jgi:acyl-CoA reductase-like NAD-dependent aldehyde dehydrogenase
LIERFIAEALIITPRPTALLVLLLCKDSVALFGISPTMPSARRANSPAAVIDSNTAATVGKLANRYGAAAATKFTDACSGSLGADEVPGAVAALRAAFDSEKTLTREWRIDQLNAFRRMISEGREELCAALQIDLHKAPFEGFATELGLVLSEIDTALAHLDEWMAPSYTANSALNIPCWSSTQADPLGVVLVLGAWNYPMQLTLAPMVGAIAAGNCIMLKPGSYSPACSHTLSRLVQRYLDPECVKVAEGDRAVTNALLDQRFDKICFTGSGYVGQLVLEKAAKHLTPCILELGGKSPCIVDQSAHLQHAAERLVWGTFLNSGQTCVRPDFLLVHEKVADAFLKLLKKTIEGFYTANPQSTEWYGRVINEKAWSRLDRIVKNCPKQYVYHGGSSDSGDKYIEPTILDYGTDRKAFLASEAMADEIFGPILPCLRYSSLDDALQIAKGLPTGKPLALYCYARDQAVISQVKRRTTSGGLCINDNLMHLCNHELPFGGVGASGMGSYHGKRSFLAFSHEKAVLEKSPMLDQSFLLRPLLAARFPPYKPYKQTLIWLFGMRLSELAVNLHRSRLFVFLLVLLAGYKMGLRITFAA